MSPEVPGEKIIPLISSLFRHELQMSNSPDIPAFLHQSGESPSGFFMYGRKTAEKVQAQLCGHSLEFMSEKHVNKFRCGKQVYFIFAISPPYHLLQVLLLFFILRCLYSFFFYLCFALLVRKIINTPSRLRWTLRTQSCCILTWAHSDYIYSFSLVWGSHPEHRE